jgi:predicted phosphoribosyltransferase
MFEDRSDAGRALAEKLEPYRDEHPLVLAIPRGGVEVGYQVAKALDADLSLLITRKLPFPGNPESGFGAIAEDGSAFVYEHAARTVPDPVIERIKERQREEIERRIEVLRKGEPLPEMSGRTVILVDDGIAMGSTMRASIQLCKHRGAGKIVVAVPVAGEQVVRDLRRLVDDVVVVETPAYFRAVAQVYRNWYDVPDAEVLEIMARRHEEQR